MLYKKIEQKYKEGLFSRCDINSAVHYFSPEDFSGLKSERVTFTSSKGDILVGYFYFKDNFMNNCTVIFDHGFGAGHRAYMREISVLCEHGYLVFSYDHTGCAESEGSGTPGLSGSLRDLNDCITFIKSHENCADKKIFCIGHSWGGFSTLNITAYHPEIEKIAVFSGFISLAQALKQNFPFPLSAYSKKLFELERDVNGDFVNACATETLKNTKADVLLIYSDNDTKVSKKYNYDPLVSELSDRPNVKFILEHGKSHNPNYTENAVKLLDVFSKKLIHDTKKGLLSSPEQKSKFKASFDWNAMTEQDERIWNAVFEHFGSR